MNQREKRKKTNPLSEVEKQLRLNSAKKIIVTFGAPGAGKTTLLKNIKKLHDTSRIVSETDKILDKTTLLGEYLTKATIATAARSNKSMQEFYFLFQMAILPERFMKCFYAQDYTLIDDSILGTFAYSMALRDLNWISEEEYAVFLENFYRYLDFHPKPTRIIYLSCEASVLKERIAHRMTKEKNREIEERYSQKYLETLNNCFQKTADLFSSLGYDFIFIDTTAKKKGQVRDIVKQELEGIWDFQRDN